MKYFRLVWAGLWRKKARTILTMLSIVVAFFLFGVLQGVNQGINEVVNNLNVDRLYTSAKSNMVDGIPIAYRDRIKSVPGVLHVSHWTFFGGYYKEAKNAIPAFATDARELFAIYREIKIKPEYLDAMERTRTGVLVSEQLADQYGWKIGDRIPLGTSIWTNKEGSNTWYFDLVGTFDASEFGGGFPSFYINYDYYDEAKAFGQGVVHYYIVRIDDPRNAVSIAKAIDTQFENSMNETRTQTESQLQQTQIKQIADINFIVNAIVGAVFFTLLFLTANTMMQSIRERIPELAVLKTLGFSDNKVLVLVLVEACVLCIIAALVGLAIAAAAFPGLKAILGNLPMPPIVVIMGVALAIGLALVSGLPPAIRAQRLNIVDALASR
jgi:putative ABC transport system permease protein